MDGLRVAGAYRWPGPVHEGNGTWWSVIDKRATEEQVNVLFTILGGQEQEPTTGFAIVGSTITNEPDPVFTDIEFEWDLENRIGRFAMENVLGATIEPINNPVTGADHHAHIHLREGFEFREAEMASASFWRKGEHCMYNWKTSYWRKQPGVTPSPLMVPTSSKITLLSMLQGSRLSSTFDSHY